METIERKRVARDIIEKGVKSVLEEAKVPLRLHLRVAQSLHKVVDQNAKDRAEFKQKVQAMLEDHKAYKQTHQGSIALAGKLIELLNNYGAEVERLTKIDHLKGQDGAPGQDAVTPSAQEVALALRPFIPLPKDGTDGAPGKDAESPDVKTLVEAVIVELQKGDKLHISHIRGGASFIKDGVKYGVEELMHGGGSGSGSSGTAVYSEVVSGATNTFTLAHTPISGSVRVYALGQRLVLTTDFTIAGAVITTVSSWSAGQIVADYNY